MKITTLILITAILQVSASSMAQKVTLKEKNAPLTVVFDQIRAQTDYDFVFTTEVVKDAKPVTINVKNEELSDVLAQIFQGQNLDFSIENKSVVVKPKEPDILDKIKIILAAIDVHGQVLDDNNQPLTGATVRTKSGSASGITDAKGYFTLKGIASDAIIVVSYIGFSPQEVPVKEDLGAIRMVKSADKLDEVQVVAYGTTDMRIGTGDVTTIKSDVLDKQPVDNPLAALEGRVPGLLIQQLSGMPDASFNVQLRGQSSINNGTVPFVVIDGVPFEPSLNLTGPYNNGGTLTSMNQLSFIDMSDIESISVLKDAAATAIYGSRGANGVILITTKKGKAGKLKMDASVTEGFQNVADPVQQLNTSQYIQMREDAFRNAGETTYPANAYDVNGTWDMNSYTNWEKVLTGNTAHYTDAQVNASGGSANMNYLIGGNFMRQTTVFPGDFGDDKGGLHVNLNTSSPDNKFKMSFHAAFTTDQNDLLTSDPSKYITLAPDAPAVYTPQGTLNWANSTWTNPLSYLLKTDQLSLNNLVSSGSLSYEIIPGLVAKADLGYTLTNSYEHNATPIAAQNPARNPTNSALFTNDLNNSFSVEPQLTYKKAIGRGLLSALLGGSIQQQNTNLSEASASHYPSDALLQSPSGAANYDVVGSNSVYKNAALFSMLDYNYNDTYIVDISGRREGSSRFGPDKEYGNFGSLSGAWVFTKEGWLKNQGVLDFGKLRASYGITGNDQIGNYQYLTLYQETEPYEGAAGFAPQSLSNPGFSWETDKKLEIGTDLGFFKDRIVINADWYRQRSSNQLVTEPLPTFVGPGSVEINLPAVVQNEGFELALTTTNIKTKDFTWTSSFNISINHNKLLSYPGLAESSEAGVLMIGQSLTTSQVYNSVGVNPTTGIYQFINSQGNLTSTPNFNTDRTQLVNTTPKYFGGFENNLRYKGFTFSFDIQFVNQVTQDPYALTYAGDGIGNILTYVWDNTWKAPGQQAKYEQANASSSSLAYKAFSYYENSNLAFINGSFARLKNASFSYDLPKQWTDAIKIGGAQVYLEGQNLFTFTGFHADPEGVYGYPRTTTLLRTIVAGLKFNL